ncbi:Rpn family recombination-promoting nuclease/putative transposase [Anaerocellum danielii]|uniref:Rpn family recombination-promoting nuclease/putative transposase n=1 Tax=Anaerocellum danielii TaxID=1387557 RepID=A0ABZ0U496_9FIRM|nr:Rpn family recombination-promoting nuclease/putative transposase [Caldicellulosiruptor danielii]WPX08540.1 Rpn family recombination-promoting nuclease/putative transposase [Caldicellulosiruptor danielii]
MEQRVPHNQYDLTFKRLFQFKEVFLNFIRSNINREWVNKIDTESLEFVDRSFIKDEFVEKEADVIYRARLEDTDIYFYVLIEPQSTADRSMPRRLFEYMSLIWKRHMEEKADELFPPIVPIVLYNGKSSWNMPTQIFKGFDIFKDDMFNYVLVDVNRLDDEKLKSRLDILSIILYLEKSRRNAEEFIGKLREVSGYVSKLPQAQVKVFCSWLLRIVRPQVREEMRSRIDELLEKIEAEGVEDVGEFIFNVQQLIQEYYREAEEKGKEKGYEEGIQEGIQRKEEEIVRRLIQKGFDDNFIAEATGVEIERIKKIREEFVL